MSRAVWVRASNVWPWTVARGAVLLMTAIGLRDCGPNTGTAEHVHRVWLRTQCSQANSWTGLPTAAPAGSR
jgi:hypothetical protein